jgi:coenzyme PQQ synthesis protein D (PqqD)
MPTDFKIVVSKDQVSRDLADEAVILNTRGIYFGLDAVGSRAWNLMLQPRMFSEICQLISEEFEVEPTSCAADLRELLEQLRAHGLIEIAP